MSDTASPSPESQGAAYFTLFWEVLAPCAHIAFLGKQEMSIVVRSLATPQMEREQQA
jgi:hypothetical protein